MCQYLHFRHQKVSSWPHSPQLSSLPPCAAGCRPHPTANWGAGSPLCCFPKEKQRPKKEGTLPKCLGSEVAELGSLSVKSLGPPAGAARWFRDLQNYLQAASVKTGETLAYQARLLTGKAPGTQTEPQGHQAPNSCREGPVDPLPAAALPARG